MGDSIQFQSATPILPNALQSVQGGLQLGQELGQANALQGLDFNDPSSVDATIRGLAAHGAIDQANSLSSLAFIKPFREDGNNALSQIRSAAEGSSTTPTPSTASTMGPLAGDATPPSAASALAGVAPAGGPVTTQPLPPAAAPASPAAAPQGGNPTPADPEAGMTPEMQLQGAQHASQAVQYLRNLPVDQRSAVWNGKDGEPGVKDFFAEKYGVPPDRLAAIDKQLTSDNGLEVLQGLFDTRAHELAIQTAHPAAVAAGLAQPPAGAPPPAVAGAPAAPPGQGQTAGPAAPGAGPAAPSPPAAAPPAGAPAAPAGGAPQQSPATGAAPASGDTVTPPPTNGPGGQGIWGKRLLDNPEALIAISKLKAAGLDLTPLTAAAESQAAPEYAQEAAVRNAGPLEAARLGTASQYNQVTLKGPNNTEIPMTQEQAIMIEKLPPNVRGQVMQYLEDNHLGGLTPAAAAYQQAGGTALAQSPYTRVEVPTPSGAPRVLSGAQFADLTGQGGSFQGITPAAQASQTGQADVATKLLTPNPDVETNAGKNVADIQRAMQAVAAVGKLDNSAEAKLQLSKALRTAGLGGPDVDQLTSNLSTANQLFNGLVATADKDTFGGRITNADLGVGQKSGIALWTPNDQVSTYLATKGAIEQRKLAFERFKQNYQGDKTNPQAIYDAWNKQGGSTSIFAEPIWQSVQIGGKPAVIQRQVKGQTWLQVGAGTGHPFYVPLNGNEGEAVQ